MLLQTNSYFVPKEKRMEHARVLRRFRQVLARLGCDHFEVYEQVGSNWSTNETTGRFVQIMRFRDRKHQQQVQAAEKVDAGAQAVIAEFCNLINFPYQQQQGLFAVGFYTSALPVARTRVSGVEGEVEQAATSSKPQNRPLQSPETTSGHQPHTAQAPPSLPGYDAPGPAMPVEPEPEAPALSPASEDDSPISDPPFPIDQIDDLDLTEDTDAPPIDADDLLVDLEQDQANDEGHARR